MLDKIILAGDIMYDKRHNSSYVPIYSDNEIDDIIDIALRGGKRILHDGECVRLDALTDYKSGLGIMLSPLGFYDFFCTNMLMQNHRDWLRLCENDKERELILRLPKKVYSEIGRNPSLEEVINCRYLGNILATSAIIKDSRNRILLTRRNTRVAIGAGYMGVSSTGSVDYTDLQFPNPVAACVIREAKEEFGLELYPEEVYLHRIVLAPGKLQPVALCNITLPFTFEEVEIYDQGLDEYDTENECYYLVPEDSIHSMLNRDIFSETAEEHINVSFKREEPKQFSDPFAEKPNKMKNFLKRKR